MEVICIAGYTEKEKLVNCQKLSDPTADYKKMDCIEKRTKYQRR